MRPIIILIVGKLPPAKDNIGAYASHLATSLRERGYDAEVWSLHTTCRAETTAPCRSFAVSRSSVGKLSRILRALRGRRGCTVLWQYNPFLYAARGFPVVLHFLPLILKVTSPCRIGVVFHEICIDPERNPRTWLWALWHRAGLWLILLGSDIAIATTESREDFIRRFAHRFLPARARGHVFATIPVGPNILPVSVSARQAPPDGVLRIGAFHIGVAEQEEALVRGIERVGLQTQLILIGTGTTVRGGRPFQPDDGRPGVVETGYLRSDEVSAILSSLDVFVGWYDDGASGRRGSLAVAFAHGLCVVSTAGPNTDHHLCREGENCLLVPYGEVVQLQEALRALAQDPCLRARLGRCARETYQQEMAWPVVAARVAEAIDAR